jgi:hypothetical protein
MVKASRPRHVALVAAALIIAAGGLSGCSKKKLTADAGYSAPEGTVSGAARLVIWREIPTHIDTYTDVNPPGLGTEDQFLRRVDYGSDLPGRIHGIIFDSSAATGYQILRRDANGGYTQLKDFVAIPTRRWLDRHWKCFAFTDDDTTRASRTYIGRGVFGGVVTAASPLTNEARDTTVAIADIAYTGGTGIDIEGNPVPLDSLFTMKWDAVPNATGYYIHVYVPSFNLTTVREQIMSGMAAPVLVGKSRDILIAYVPAPNPPTPSMSLKMPVPTEVVPGARIMTARVTNYGTAYRVRVSAVDRLGRFIAYTSGSLGIPLTGNTGVPEVGSLGSLPTGQYAIYRLGATTVIPSRRVTAAAMARAPEVDAPPRRR